MPTKILHILLRVRENCCHLQSIPYSLVKSGLFEKGVVALEDAKLDEGNVKWFKKFRIFRKKIEEFYRIQQLSKLERAQLETERLNVLFLRLKIALILAVVATLILFSDLRPDLIEKLFQLFS